jgi:hypothetical protein
MLNDRYFNALGCPGESRLQHLPRWAIRYERELRALCSWWNDAKRGKPERPCPVPREPAGDRVFRLPVWAFEWLNDLRFEVYWQRLHALPEEPMPLPLPPTYHNQRARALA